MAPIIKIKYEGNIRRFPFPTTNISDFIEYLKKEYHIPSNTTLKLLEGTEELTHSATLELLGVQNAAELTLVKVNDTPPLTIKVQTITGQLYALTLTSEAKVKDLFDSIQKETKFTTTYPLLFNHRMHLFVTPKFLDEPLTQLLNLTTIQDNNVPHFYLFECERKFELHAYDYSKNSKDIFIMSELWQPKSCQQSNEAMEVYLNVMFALVRVLLTAREADFDSVHHIYMPQFLIVLRRYLFPPACLAFKHALEGALFNFEKSLLSEGFFQLFRRLLPDTIPDNELFTHTAFVFCWILDNGDHTSIENACYEVAEFSNEERRHTLVRPVLILNDKIKPSASERFILMECDDVRKVSGISLNDYQLQTDLIGLLGVMGQTRRKQDVFEIFSSDYTLWSPNAKVSLSPINDVNEQIRRAERLPQKKMDELKQQLATNDLYSIFTFADPSKLSKHNHAQLVSLKSGHIVYIKSAAKNSEDSFICFDPSSEKEDFQKSDVTNNDVLITKSYAIVRENGADIRKIEQITCILFDISGSMNAIADGEKPETTLLDLSTVAFGAWRDRLRSYRLPHAIGLIYFGADDQPMDDSLIAYLTRPPQIVVQCNVTRDFTQFENALSKPPPCGFDTPLYDAIQHAIQAIQTFRKNERSRLSPTCKELILCLTDGADNCSRVTQPRIMKQLLDEKIVFDAISFDKVSNPALIEFCEKTKGYYYTNITHNRASMLDLFELEAAISIQDRDESVFGQIEKPLRRKPALLNRPAVAAKQAKLGDGRASSMALRRIMQEIKHLNNTTINNFELYVSKENIFFWKLIMHGETGTPYADGRWLLFVEFPENFPQQVPQIRFITKIYHCNVNDDGKICHDILTSAWSQKTSMHNVFMELLRLLREPNADDALSSVKGTQYKDSKETYNNTVIEWKKQHASASVEELKKMYALE